MRLNEIAIWWSSTEEMISREVVGYPQFVVLDQGLTGTSHSRPFDYLTNSVGACFMGWERADPKYLAAYVMMIFHQAVIRDGVDPKEAHNELMKIDEYCEWQAREEGPFRDMYWQWADDRVPGIPKGQIDQGPQSIGALAAGILSKVRVEK